MDDAAAAVRASKQALVELVRDMETLAGARDVGTPASTAPPAASPLGSDTAPKSVFGECLSKDQADTLIAKCQANLVALRAATMQLPDIATLEAPPFDAAEAAEAAEVQLLQAERDRLREEVARKNAGVKALLDTMRGLQTDVDLFTEPELLWPR